jgi:hypothetical protein
VTLTDDQRAMLRLLAQREEGYEDMAALMGISVEEVREKVKEALVEVEETEETAAATPEPPPEPTTPEPEAAGIVTPPPTSPQPPSAPAQPEPAPAKAGIRPPKLPLPKLPENRGPAVGLAAGALVVVVLVIILIVGGNGGGGSSSTTSSGEGETESIAAAAAENPNLTDAILAPVGGEEGEGVALFGRLKKNVLLQVTAKDLEPSRSGESYAIWLSHAGKAMVPVGTAKATSAGELAARFQVPTAVLLLVAKRAFDQIDVTRTSDSQLSAAIASARRSKKESAYTGTAVLSGEITGPLIGAAAAKKGR